MLFLWDENVVQGTTAIFSWPCHRFGHTKCSHTLLEELGQLSNFKHRRNSSLSQQEHSFHQLRFERKESDLGYICTMTYWNLNKEQLIDIIKGNGVKCEIQESFHELRY